MKPSILLLHSKRKKGPASQNVTNIMCLFCYAHGVSPTKLSRNAHWGNDDVVVE
jgi:hypothetical protein